MKSRKQTAVTLAIWLLLSLLLAACGKKTDNESAVLQEEVVRIIKNRKKFLMTEQKTNRKRQETKIWLMH